MNTQTVYKEFAQFYDTYVGAFSEDLPLYLYLCKKSSRILEIGCGTGRVLKTILEAGHEIVGVDISPEMLSIAKSKLSNYLVEGRLSLLTHDFHSISLNSRFDCVLVTFYTFNYLLGDDGQLKFLQHIFESMAKNGLVALDLFYPEPKRIPETDNRWRCSKYESYGKSIVLKQKKRMIGDIEERSQIFVTGENNNEILTRRRYISKQRANFLLTEIGFDNIEFIDGYDVSKLHTSGKDEKTTSQFVVIARRP